MHVRPMRGPAPFYTNTYFLLSEDGTEAAIIDPVLPAEKYLSILKENEGSALRYILLTHGHDDHTESAAVLSEATGAPVCVFAEDTGLFGVEAGRLLQDGETLPLGQDGEDALQVLHTPGHSPGCCCFLADQFLFSGDTLFAGSMGRIDFPGGDENAMAQSLQRLMLLPDETKVLPGHGPYSTIAEERESNPFVRRFTE